MGTCGCEDNAAGPFDVSTMIDTLHLPIDISVLKKEFQLLIGARSPQFSAVDVLIEANHFLLRSCKNRFVSQLQLGVKA